jgi:hypothetical protein
MACITRMGKPGGPDDEPVTSAEEAYMAARALGIAVMEAEDAEAGCWIVSIPASRARHIESEGHIEITRKDEETGNWYTMNIDTP